MRFIPDWLTVPPDYEEISNSIDDYDTAITCVDKNIAEAISFAKSNKKPTIFIYFSDHGESPTLDDGHDSSRFRIEMATIPFVIYFNEAARLYFPDRFAKMKGLAANRNISTLAQLVPTLLDLMGYAIGPNGGLDVPPPMGSKWTPYPILVRQTSDGISYLRFAPASEAPTGDNGEKKSGDGRETCFAPAITLPNTVPAPRNVDCVALETVRP